MTTKLLQQRFTQGEFSPEMIGRSDIDQYYSGAETLNNVIVIPQGGVKRRGGTRHITSLIQQLNVHTPSSASNPNGGTAANSYDVDASTVMLTTTNISTTNPYIVTSHDLGSDKAIGYVTVSGLKLTVSGTSTSDFFIEVATSAAPTTWFTTSAIPLTTTETASIKSIGGSYRYVRLVKTTGTDLGTNRISLAEMQVLGTTASATYVRQMPFEFNREQVYMVVFTDRLLTIFANTTLVAYVPAPMFTSARIQEINWTQSADTAIIVHEDIPPHKLVRGATDADWQFVPITFDFMPRYDFTPTSSNPAGTITPSATSGVITLTASGTPFTSEAVDVGQIIDGGGGRARIIQYLTTSTVKAVTLIPFYGTTAITSGAWVYEGGFENVWSSSKGWPKSVTFHDGRLWFGGSTERPQTLWGSKVGLFFDFDPGQIYDDDAIDVTLDTDQVNAIVNLFSQRTLQVFTTGGEFASLQSSGTAITPTNIDIRRQTQEGSRLGLRPVEIDGGTIYVKFGGKSIIRFLFDDIQQAYSSGSISTLSSHLLSTPIDISVDKTNADNDASILFIVNTDGTVACASLLGEQKVVAFTKLETDAAYSTVGQFKSIAVNEDGIFVVIQRTIPAGNTLVFEKMDETYLMDGAYKTTGAVTVVTGATWLAGRTVKLRVDGANVSDVVVADGTTTGSISAFADYSGTVAGTVLVTSANHGLTNYSAVTITGTTNYNGTFAATIVNSSTFYITDTWVSNDATGTWTVPSGALKVYPASTTSVEFGINFTTTVKDLPVEADPNSVRAGSTLGKKKRVVSVALQLKSTSGISINGNAVTTPVYTAAGTTSAIANFTGTIRTEGISDSTDAGQVTITQSAPNPLTLLALSKEVKF